MEKSCTAPSTTDFGSYSSPGTQVLQVSSISSISKYRKPAIMATWPSLSVVLVIISFGSVYGELPK